MVGKADNNLLDTIIQTQISVRLSSMGFCWDSANISITTYVARHMHFIALHALCFVFSECFSFGIIMSWIRRMCLFWRLQTPTHWTYDEITETRLQIL